jgi:hypothetical protein
MAAGDTWLQDELRRLGCHCPWNLQQWLDEERGPETMRRRMRDKRAEVAVVVVG